MSPQPLAWEKYRRTLREFDAVLEHARAVSASIAGHTPAEASLSYGEQLFVSLICQCFSLKRLAPDPERRVSQELWDLPSVYAIARCVVDAHDAFFYIVGTASSAAERTFRIRLWELHDFDRRLQMLDGIGSMHPEVDAIRLKKQERLTAVLSSEFFDSLPSTSKGKLKKGESTLFGLDPRDLCSCIGVDFGYRSAVNIHLSQYVHSHPFAIHQLFAFRAGSEEAIALMNMPFQYTLSFLSRVTTGMRELFVSLAPLPPSRTARVMAKWTGVAERGVKAAGY